jgi:hypothetical protein
MVLEEEMRLLHDGGFRRQAACQLATGRIRPRVGLPLWYETEADQDAQPIRFRRQERLSTGEE